MIENIKNRIIVGLIIELFSEWCLLLYFLKNENVQEIYENLVEEKRKI